VKLGAKRWVYLIISMFICLCAGIGYAWSVFQNPIVSKFGWDAAAVSITFTLQIITSTMTPMLTGKLLKNIKTRKVILMGGILLGACVFSTGYINSIVQLYLIYGIGSGAGIGLIYPSLMAYSVKLFPDKMGVSAGMLAASYGSGAIIWAPLAAGITSTHGVLAAFKVLGIIFLIVVCALSLFIGEIPKNYMAEANNAEAEYENNASSIDKTTREMVRTPVFYVVVLMFVFGISSGIMLMGHASPIIQSALKFTPAKAAAIVGLLAVFNTCGRLFWGWASDKCGRYAVIFTLFTVQSVAMFSLSLVNSANMFIGLIFVVGLCYGGFATIIAPVTADLFGMKNLSSNYGFMYISYGIAGVVGPMMASWMSELNNGSYLQAFVAASTFGVIGLALAAYIYMKSKKIELGVGLESEYDAV